ncbi:HEAT repeat domain-containing protein [Spirosoma sp. SC4-14]|uniref:HEAT repeat domain-containing protein n=1 Tax=Spirosoma sp. SC4-14 TaxID=3128900 RepID=UPI0030D320B4
MNKRKTAYKLFNMQQGEGKTVLLFVAYSLFMGVAVAVFYTCTTSLFLTNFNRTQLPLAFIAGGLLVYGLGLLVRQLHHRLTFVRMNGYLLTFLLVSVSCLLLVPDREHNKWLYFVLFLWNRVFVFVNGLTFWATAARIFNFQQAKRLFSFISMGDVISSVLSYFSVPILLSFIPTEQLLLISLFSLLICAGLMIVINKRFHEQLNIARKPQPASDYQQPQETLEKNSQLYYQLLYFLAFMSVFALAYVEFMFTVEVKEVFPNKEILASFLGIFFGICSIIEAVIRAFLYNRLISAYSIRVGVVMLPLCLLFSYMLTAIYGTIFGPTSLFIAFIALSRFFMSSVRRSISEPVYQVLFQPIPAAERSLVQSKVEGGPKALGNIMPGVLLLGLNSLSFITMVHLSYIFLVILIFWAIAAFRIQTEYRKMLRNVVLRSSVYLRKITNVSTSAQTDALPNLPQASNSSFDEMVRLASSANAENRARAALELGHSGRYYAYIQLQTLLDDSHPAVRKAAIIAAGNLRKPELWPRLFEHLAIDRYHDTARSALLTIGEPVVPALVRFFNEADEQSSAAQIRIIELINEIGGHAALRFLRTRINHPVQSVRDKVFEGLHRMNHRATVTERPHLLRELDDQVALLVWLAATRLDMNSYPKQSPIIRALRNEKQLVVPKIFNLLGVLCGDDRFDVIGELITQKSDEVKGYLVELLSNLLPAEVKNTVLPLFSDVPLPEKLRLCSINYPQQRLSIEERLHDIINKDFNKLTPWVKAVAIRELLNWHETDPTPILVANAASSDKLIAETSFYVLRILNPSRFAELHRMLLLQPDSAQCAIADYVANEMTEADLLVLQNDTVCL